MKVETESVLQEITARARSIRATAAQFQKAGVEVAASQLEAHVEGLEAAAEIIKRHQRVQTGREKSYEPAAK